MMGEGRCGRQRDGVKRAKNIGAFRGGPCGGGCADKEGMDLVHDVTCSFQHPGDMTIAIDSHACLEPQCQHRDVDGPPQFVVYNVSENHVTSASFSKYRAQVPLEKIRELERQW